ncbi:MAG: MEDS domain-containing protein [Chloroflexi bacterium]|nr:MEDS domain-containing protein [Chloroflexota bacterium]
MSGQLRQTGIDIVGDVPWGTHFCQFYQTRQDLEDILVPYFSAGLRHNEFCMWVTAEPLNVDDATKAMKKAMPDFERYLEHGQIEIIPHTEWYLKNDVFDAQRVLNGWVDKLNMAQAKGYDGLRLTGNTLWLEENHWAKFTDYEAMVNSVIGNYSIIALCSYSLSRCSAAEVIDVVMNHQFALIRREKQWEVIESSVHKQAEAQLQQAYAELTDIQASIPVAILLVDEERRVHEVNQAAARFAGRTVDEMLGTRGGEALRCLHSLDDPRGCGFGPTCQTCIVRHSIMDTFETGHSHINEETTFSLAHSNKGEDRWLLVSTSPVKFRGLDRVVVCLQDTTELKRTEERLGHTEASYRTLVESSPDGIAYLDSQGYIINCNEALGSLLGYNREELKGKNFRQFTTKISPERMENQWDEVRQRGQLEDELSFVSKDGLTIPVWAKAAAISDPNGDSNRLIVYVRDLTERKKLEQLKDEFIGLVSHELKTPLTVISGSLNTVISERDRLSEAEIQQLTQDAVLESESLSHLVENLLELSRFQAQKLALYTESINIKNIIRETVGKVKRQAPSHKFITSIPNALPPIKADPLRIERILYNLMENATKYSPSGTEIKISARVEPERVVISVSDQGRGLSRQEQAKLFSPFQRLEQSINSGISGAGLGLMVCRRLVEAHSGQIWVESKPGKGSTFSFALPYNNSTADQD